MRLKEELIQRTVQCLKPREIDHHDYILKLKKYMSLLDRETVACSLCNNFEFGQGFQVSWHVNEKEKVQSLNCKKEKRCQHFYRHVKH